MLMITFMVETQPQNMVEWVVFLAKEYAQAFWQGTIITLYIAIAGTLIGFLVGFILGLISDIEITPDDGALKKGLVWLVKGISNIYIEIFRDTPMIVQAMVIYYGLRSFGIEIEAIPAGLLVTVLNTGAYMSETVRAGINSVDHGQKEGARALGMSSLKTMLIVVLPQAFRNIIPEMANMFLTNLKMTSVLNVIGVNELFMVAKTTGAVYYKYFEAYLVIALIYFVLCFIFNRLFMFLEKKMKGKADYALAVEYLNDGY